MDPNLFFLESGKDVQKAKAVCNGCQVQQDCFDDVMAQPYPIWQMGVAGGTCGRDRIRLRNQENKRRKESA